ncbi:hypothetical protein [Arthrobacter sp. UYCu723]
MAFAAVGHFLNVQDQLSGAFGGCGAFWCDRTAAILRFAGMEHRYTDFVMGPAIMVRREVFTDHPFQHVAVGEDTGFLRAAHAAGKIVYLAAL